MRVRGGEHVPGGLGWKRLRDELNQGSRSGKACLSAALTDMSLTLLTEIRDVQPMARRRTPPLAIRERKNIRTSERQR